MPKRATNQDKETTASSLSPPARRTKKRKYQQQPQPEELVDLPDSLKELKQKFEATNIYCAFCDARITASVTLQGIQTAVPNLTCQDLAAINVIIPNFVKFNPVSEETLEVEFGRAVSKKASKEKHGHALGNRGDEWANIVGLFGKKYNNETIVKPDAIKKMIEQQNKLFIKSLSDYLKQCKEKNLDPTNHLFQELEKYMPCPFFEDMDDTFNDDENEKSGPNNASQRKSMLEIIEGLKKLDFYTGQLDIEENQKTFPGKSPIYGGIELSKEVTSALEERGIKQLYIHQTEALQGLFDNQHVIVSTSTASGKSLIYQIPVLEELLKDKNSKAMYIFPTKALAQDQKRALEDIMHQMPNLEDIMISTFDGDTPMDQRAYIRHNASVIFTNPDMLHRSILPHGKVWGHFLSKLKYVVVDELHVYNGLFGTHVALIMRRLRRLCSYNHNESVQFISCSATIDHSYEHMKTVFGIENVKLVDQDGAPHGKKEFVVWNPSLIHPTDNSSERRGAIAEGANIFEYLLENNIRTIAFCKVRKTCELLMKQLRDNLQQKQKKSMMNRVMSYRGGYTPYDRRKIESQMFNGELLGIVATNALELGVDIGTLDAVLMIGVPWSISALWQQSGRSGRRNADSLTLISCDSNPMDQYYANNASVLFEKKAEALSIELENSIVLESHIQCAAEELPIDVIRDQMYFGLNLAEICEEHLAKIDHGLYRPNARFRPYPTKFVNIRNINEDTFAVVDVTDNKNVVIEEIEVHRASFEIYEGAIFIHQGRTYLVQECNIDKRYARVQLTKVDWTTIQRDYTNVDAISTDESKHIGETKNFVCYGQVRVKTIVFGYYRVDKRRRILDAHDVYMDPILVQSTGVWADAPGTALAELDQLDIDSMAAIHAASHCLISLIPRFVYSAVGDLRTECKNPNATRSRPARVALYETQPCGIVRQAYKCFDQLIEKCIQQIRNCKCVDGCPSCVHLLLCSEQNQVCSKEGALIVLCAMQGKNDAKLVGGEERQ